MECHRETATACLRSLRQNSRVSGTDLLIHFRALFFPSVWFLRKWRKRKDLILDLNSVYFYIWNMENFSCVRKVRNRRSWYLDDIFELLFFLISVRCIFFFFFYSVFGITFLNACEKLNMKREKYEKISLAWNMVIFDFLYFWIVGWLLLRYSHGTYSVLWKSEACSRTCLF